MPVMTYDVGAKREDAHGSLAWTKQATITLDTDLAGRDDAFNPAELLLAALAACMLKGIERVTPTLEFQLQGVEVKVHGVREEKPPRMASITYELIVETEESDRRLELLHENVKRFGTVYNTVAAGSKLVGTIRRSTAQV